MFFIKCLLYALFPMAHMHFDAEFLVYMLRKVLCRVDAAMLSAGASEAEHQVGESARDVALHVGICKLVDAIEEGEYLAVVLKESYYRFVETRELLVRLIASGVVGGAAVEHIAATVARLIGRDSLAIGEAEHAHT